MLPISAAAAGFSPESVSTRRSLRFAVVLHTGYDTPPNARTDAVPRKTAGFCWICVHKRSE